MIELQNVEKYYGNTLALDKISFSIEKGNIVGLLGKNGAGKSTLMNIMTGYLPASGGSVTVDGASIEEAPQEVKGRIGYLPEKPPLYDTMTVQEFLSYVAKLKKVPYGKIPSAVAEITEQTGLYKVKSRLIRNLSKGYQQRVGIAQAMTGTPDILVLDEPTVGLDPSQVVEFRTLLREYGKEHIILVSSHILSEISEVCGRILILNEGKLIKDCPVTDLNHGSGNHIAFRVDASREEFASILREEFPNCQYEYKGEGERGSSDWHLRSDAAGEDLRRKVFQVSARNGFSILQMIPVNAEIEEVFLDLTSVRKKEDG